MAHPNSMQRIVKWSCSHPPGIAHHSLEPVPALRSIPSPNTPLPTAAAPAFTESVNQPPQPSPASDEREVQPEQRRQHNEGQQPDLPPRTPRVQWLNISMLIAATAIYTYVVASVLLSMQ
jgi:hypothetical protein